MGLAGVMGGEKSGIAADTTDVFLEAAFFPPDTVAGVARRFGFVTDAAQRFERGVDPRGQERAIERATQLLRRRLPAAVPGRTIVTQVEAQLPQAAERHAAPGARREPPRRSRSRARRSRTSCAGSACRWQAPATSSA